MTSPLQHAYNTYLDTLTEQQQTQHIAETIKHTLRKENTLMHTYSILCENCGKYTIEHTTCPHCQKEQP